LQDARCTVFDRGLKKDVAVIFGPIGKLS